MEPYHLFSASIIWQVYLQWRRKLLESSSELQAYKKKSSELTWVDDNAFEVVVAICDAFIPKLDENSISGSSVIASFENLYPGISKIGILPKDFVYHKKHIARGALESDIPFIMCLAFQNLLSKNDQIKLFLLLKLLSTTVGCFLITGNFAPFQVLISLR